METAPYVEQAIKRVVNATTLVKKAELARRAGVPESTLRDLGSEGWTPNAATLHKLEQAAIEIERENQENGSAPKPAAA